MCGIAGFARSTAATDPAEAEAVAGAMASRLAHRGPDRIATWSSPSARAFLGHSRLKVIDLEGGAQPMGSPDGDTQVVFNGEIYNHHELRKELEGRGFAFRTRSDTEVLVHGYRAWGEGLVSRLEGMFAFAVWDEAKRRVLLARDRAGKKPLYVVRTPSMVAFASEMKALLVHPEVPRVVRPEAIHTFLAIGYVPGSSTLYRGVEQLPPGHLAWIDDGNRLRTKRYWALPVEVRSISPTRARREVRQLLVQAVARRMEADVPLGAFLSGGIDSSAVVGLMARLSDRPVKTFSIGFEGDAAYDETAAARETAEFFGTEHTEFRVGPQSQELVDRLVDAYDEPFADSSAIPTHVVSGLAREHVTVALTGDGGDELFAGYQRFQAMRLAALVPGWVARGAAALAGSLPIPTDFRNPLRRATRFFQGAAGREEERWLRWVGLTPRPEALLGPRLAASGGGGREVLLDDFRERLRPRSTSDTLLSRVLRLNFETYLSSDLLVKADRCSMAHGLELRSPLLDRELTEYAFGLPDGRKIRMGTGKHILREAVGDLLPPGLFQRPKMGFAVPLPAWFRGPWRPLLYERLLNPSGEIWGWLDPAPVRILVREHERDEADHGHLLWALLTLAVWLDRERAA